MQNIEFQETEGLEYGATNHLAMLRLNSNPTTHNTNPTTHSDPPTTFSDHCTVCGSMKRRSPSSSSLQEEPNSSDSQPRPKKPSLQPPSDDDHHHLHGFKKIPLPTPSPVPMQSYPILHRCSSDPINSPETNTAIPPVTQSPDSFAGLGSFSNPQTPENVKINASATTLSPARGTASASLPPLPPTLRRSVSDPTSSRVSKLTPPPPTQARGEDSSPCGVPRTFSRSSSSGEIVTFQAPVDSIIEESPDSKRLRRMKEKLREMSQWCREIAREEEIGAGSEDNNMNTTKVDASAVIETEENVTVETVGECSLINFKCPCGCGYQVLLSGNNCYYKLM